MTMMAMSSSGLDASVPPELYVSGVSKSFGDVRVIDDATLSVAAGEVLALVGPSGAGKTTLCRIIAGLEQPSAGSIYLHGRDITGQAASERRMALMFESYALYPHLSVRENVMSPLRARARRRQLDGAAAKVKDALTLLEVPHLADRQPVALSGGQKQRVALARALVQDPTVLMLDEPISHLDAKLRHKLRGEIKRMLSGRSHPSIWSTPDGLEALSVGDRVAVIHSGRIEQIGTPEDIWLRPASVKVAKLFGDPPTNVLSGALLSEGGKVFFSRPDMRIELPQDLAEAAARANVGDVHVGLKPKSLSLVEDAGGTAGRIYSNEAFGKHSILTVQLDGGDLVKIKTGQAMGHVLGDRIFFACKADECLLFHGETGALIAKDR